MAFKWKPNNPTALISCVFVAALLGFIFWGIFGQRYAGTNEGPFPADAGEKPVIVQDQ